MSYVVRRIALSATMVVGLTLTTPAAMAQTTPEKGEGKSADPNIDEARQRYQRGLQLFNEGNYEAARVEFERAYQLAPSYKILYNVGLCYEQLGDYVQALTTLQRYLEQGGKDISEERRNEVNKELAQIRPRIAKVTLHTNVPGTDVTVDDACATTAGTGTVECGPIDGTSRIVFMNPGRRRITARHEGYLPETQLVTVAGSDRIDVTLTLKPFPKQVAAQEKKSNPWLLPTYIGFGVTGAALITAGVTGIMANNAADDQKALVDKFPADRASLDDAKDKTNTLGFVTDAFLIGSAVTAAASTYFLIRAINWKGEQGPVNVQVGLSSVGVSGHF